MTQLSSASACTPATQHAHDSIGPTHESSWRDELRQAIRDSRELLKRLDLEPEAVALSCSDQFPVLVPESFLARMSRGNPLDPLLRQVIPLADEDLSDPRFVADPVQDLAAREAPGVLHKYQGRALLVVTGACAIHCRYCFRRHFPYGNERVSGKRWEQTLEHLAGDATIEEVLLSGGDPLTIDDQGIIALLDDLEQLPHLKRIRIHTRLPIVIPRRVTDSLLARLARGPTQKVIVVHVNHAQEIDEPVREALLRLAREVTLLNQSVLLRGINDQLHTLKQLSERLIECRTIPYYLHLLDPVRGASHFDVPARQGVSLIQQLRACLPGYAVPRLVREVPGASAKTVFA